MLYDRLADLSVTIDDVSTARLERETSSAFTRVTTEITLEGPSRDAGSNTGSTRDGESSAESMRGVGEDVAYDATDHEVLAETGLPDLTGEYTLESFSNRLADLDLFPGTSPGRDVFRNYRRWGFESAALDLALRQAQTGLASRLDRSLEPVHFVTSMRLGDPPTTDRLEALRERVPDVEFKLDPTLDWDDDIVDAIVSRVDEGAIRILDLKGQYEGTDVDAPADRQLYERVLEAFPNAVIEDPALTPETRPLFDDPAVRARVSWDAPIHGLDDVEALPWEPDWLNVKPSRFGSLESLLETLAYCDRNDIRCYGGGQFELGVGRSHIQQLAALFYPDSPNDVAPRPYNDPSLAETLPASPLEPAADPVGFRWGSRGGDR